MIAPYLLTKLFSFNAELIYKHTDGLSHADSLRPLAVNGNSLNWTLGHIISARANIFMHIPGKHVWPDSKRARYRHGSANISQDEAGVLQIDELLRDFELSQQRLLMGLSQLSMADLSVTTGYGDETKGGRLAYLQFHETHHVGQIMAAAQMVGQQGGWLDDWAI